MIENLLNHVHNYIQAHPHIGGLFAFLVAFAESLPLIGTIIPGSITMTFIGILVGRGALGFSTTLLLAFLGAFAGDVIGFWIGKRYGQRISNMWPFRKNPKWLLLGEQFIKKHGGKSIIIGRFIGPTRSSMPLIAGLLKMRWSNFIIATIPSAILWALAYLLPGVLIGAISLVLPKEIATSFTIISLVIIIFMWLIFWAIQRFFVFIAATINRLIDRAWEQLNRHHSSKFIIRMITNQNHPEDHHQLTLLFLAVISFILFLVLIINAGLHVGLYRLNAPIFHFFQSLNHHGANKFFIVITALGYNIIIAAIIILLAIYLVIRRQWYTFWHVIGLTLLTFCAIGFFKIFFYSPRPTGVMYFALSSSFPSGHSCLSVSILGFLTFLIAQCLAKKWHWIPYTIGSVIIFLVCLSRLYLGAHWFTDVIASIFLGFTLLFLAIISYRRQQPVYGRRSIFLVAILLSILIPWAGSAIVHYHRDMNRYMPYYPNQKISMIDWWNNPASYLPTYRLSRFGNPIQPFNMQWADQVEHIKEVLLKQGWHVGNIREDIKSLPRPLMPKTNTQPIVLFPQLYRGKLPVLFMTRHAENHTTIELRLWQTGTSFIDNSLPLLIGSVNYHLPTGKTLQALRPSLQISLLRGAGLNELSENITADYTWKIVKVNLSRIPRKIELLHWNQEILIVKPKGY